MHSTATSADKIAFLRSPDAYAERPERVDFVETHFAWLFLGDRFAYKLKKPMRFERIDLKSIESRRASCELELTLNRRLAESTYLAIVPLTSSARGMRLGGETGVVDWLVKMHRLPGDRSLDAAARSGKAGDAEVGVVLRKLARFYRHTPAAPWSADEYREVLETRTGDYARRLLEPGLSLDPNLVRSVEQLQRSRISRAASELDRRVSDGRIVDAHGDLRPEHIFLGENPQIIDCLEFSIELRWLDTAEELAFLALECEQLGAAVLARHILALYREACEDDISPFLLDLYSSQRSVVRALISAWHALDDTSERAHHWRERATRYLELAQQRLTRGASRRTGS